MAVRGDDGRGRFPPCSTVSSGAGFRSRSSVPSKGEISRATRGCRVPSEKTFAQAFAARWIWSDARLERPDLLHVLDDQMVDVASPYPRQASSLRSNCGRFCDRERGLKLSRRWCRRLIATGPDLADELVDGLASRPRHRPDSAGISRQREPDDEARWPGQIPVIGAGGPREEISGLCGLHRGGPAGCQMPGMTSNS